MNNNYGKNTQDDVSRAADAHFTLLAATIAVSCIGFGTYMLAGVWGMTASLGAALLLVEVCKGR